ncbi:molybdopterin-guanine dinucleotide biosynthesis protein B [Virgibacillus natechei]|uniref:Molybdopterin-guanine dinucleotide biosynthesis protein B n=1 Tax=Virgibacillus natechei TaxID=1216297 RepID=A0ABS4IHH3_9BACI|nr:molybdopterin-guanine dinucleotide biosynthesis protein B [Virgibacillus natechei]MBP1969896.1 molybdopterin-guanine dinucleotide biosynthesis protein B [Virgibacillus natechei]UZD13438.1 molybdopterin-guanine dinucleotide biosynthesis protein B [Virgibacillus natechei]
MEIIQIVGYKNSGKTTLAKALIETLANQGSRVASLKHHGHGGVPLGIEETDSAKHRRAGAVLSGVEGDGLFQVSNQQPWAMEEMLAIYQLKNIEVVIMEGFKKQSYKKVVLVRKEEDLPLLEELTNIKAVLTPLELEQESYPYPIFNRTEMEVLVDWIVARLI